MGEEKKNNVTLEASCACGDMTDQRYAFMTLDGITFTCVKDEQGFTWSELSATGWYCPTLTFADHDVFLRWLQGLAKKAGAQ
jgi:hypothetical protein